MAKQQRTMRVEQRSQLAALSQLEHRSDEELEAETRFKAAAQAILGQRAAQRYDVKVARAHFQRALAASRPQERLQLRRMADAALAYAERRPDDYARAAERLGIEAPTKRQLLGMKFIGLVAPPASAGIARRAYAGSCSSSSCSSRSSRSAWGSSKRSRCPSAALTGSSPLFWGFVLVLIALGVLIFVGRRRQRAAQAKAAAGQRARRRAPVHPEPAEALGMCGRYSLAGPNPAQVQAQYPVLESVEIRQRYNVAPGDDVLAVTTDKAGAPRGELLRWGLVPSWSKSAGLGPEDDQRPVGDGRRAPGLPALVSEHALPDHRRRLL